MCMTVPEAGTRAARLPARCSVNGRFLGQPVTGVQRYAREIVREMRLLIGTEDESVELVVPPGMAIVAELPPFPVRAAGWGRTHLGTARSSVWETGDAREPLQHGPLGA